MKMDTFKTRIIENKIFCNCENARSFFSNYIATRKLQRLDWSFLRCNIFCILLGFFAQFKTIDQY